MLLESPFPEIMRGIGWGTARGELTVLAGIFLGGLPRGRAPPEVHRVTMVKRRLLACVKLRKRQGRFIRDMFIFFRIKPNAQMILEQPVYRVVKSEFSLGRQGKSLVLRVKPISVFRGFFITCPPEISDDPQHNAVFVFHPLAGFRCRKFRSGDLFEVFR